MATHYSALEGHQDNFTAKPAKALGRKSLALRLLSAWLINRQNKRVLRKLDRAQLEDAGISPDALRNALDAPFWRSPQSKISCRDMERIQDRAMQVRTEYIRAGSVKLREVLGLWVKIVRARFSEQMGGG